jgi:hypothetical protein
LHSSIEFFGGSNRWSRNVRDMEPEKSSIGEISSKISSRPDCVGTSSRPAASASSTRACQRSLPSSQSNESTWRARRFGTSSGSRIFAKLIRRGALVVAEEVREAVREAAKSGPSDGSRSVQRMQNHLCQDTGENGRQRKGAV